MRARYLLKKRIPRFARGRLKRKAARMRQRAHIHAPHIERHAILSAHRSHELLIAVAFLAAQAMVEVAGAHRQPKVELRA